MKDCMKVGREQSLSSVLSLLLHVELRLKRGVGCDQAKTPCDDGDGGRRIINDSAADNKIGQA